jgi:hypothetical protein
MLKLITGPLTCSFDAGAIFYRNRAQRMLPPAFPAMSFVLFLQRHFL